MNPEQCYHGILEAFKVLKNDHHNKDSLYNARIEFKNASINKAPGDSYYQQSTHNTCKSVLHRFFCLEPLLREKNIIRGTFSGEMF